LAAAGLTMTMMPAMSGEISKASRNHVVPLLPFVVAAQPTRPAKTSQRLVADAEELLRRY